MSASYSSSGSEDGRNKSTGEVALLSSELGVNNERSNSGDADDCIVGGCSRSSIGTQFMHTLESKRRTNPKKE